MKVVIIKSEETTVVAPGLILKPVVRTTYTLDDHGPFTVDIDKDKFTATKLREEIDTFARELGTVIKGWES